MKALTRKEKILNGENLAPLTRPEIFTKKAVNEGGGGGGLPAYTEADIDKSLTIKKAAPVEGWETVISTQEVTYTGAPAVINNGSITFITAEDDLRMVVNGEELPATASGTSTLIVEAVSDDVTYRITYSGKIDETTFTVIASDVPQGDYSVALKKKGFVQPKMPKTIIPRVTVTLEAQSYFSMNYWAAAFPEDSGVDSAFFENAQVGDKATFVLDGETYESTAVNYLSNMVLFPIGEIYVVGYASIFGGIGLAAMEEPAEMTHTISGTQEVDKVEPKWEEDLPDVDHSGDYLSVVGKGVIYDYDEMVAFINAHPIVAFNYGYDKWLSAGYTIEEGVEACYHFLIYENGAVTHHKYGVIL